MGLLRVIKPGFFTTIQDAGRVGYRRFGVPVSGAMDSKSMVDANEIVGNSANNPVIECTFEGGVFEVETEAVIAITGADSEIRVNNREISRYKAIQLKSGDRLKVPHPKKGSRTYIAIRGLWRLPKVMESYSTYVPGSFGGYEGRPLKSGDVIQWQLSAEKNVTSEKCDIEIPYLSSKIALDVFPGPEWDWLAEHQKRKLLESLYLVASTSNRMAIRFTGSPIKTAFLQMKSAAVAPGILQLPPSGIPILLMQDAQTVGGYPRVLRLATYHQWRAGQLVPNNQVRFALKA